jgi:hypothetical protein
VRNEAERRAGRERQRLSNAREEMARARWDGPRRIEDALALSRDGADGAGEAEALLLRGILWAETGVVESSCGPRFRGVGLQIYGVPEGNARALLERANLERDLGAFDRQRLSRGAEGPDAALGRALLDLMRDDFTSAESGYGLSMKAGERTRPVGEPRYTRDPGFRPRRGRRRRAPVERESREMRFP